MMAQQYGKWVVIPSFTYRYNHSCKRFLFCIFNYSITIPTYTYTCLKQHQNIMILLRLIIIHILQYKYGICIHLCHFLLFNICPNFTLLRQCGMVNVEISRMQREDCFNLWRQKSSLLRYGRLLFRASFIWYHHDKGFMFQLNLHHIMKSHSKRYYSLF